MPKTFANAEIAQILENIGDILKLQGANRFRVIAFENAAKAIAELGQSVAGIHVDGKLTDIPGIGKGIAADITQLLETGQIDFYEKLKAEVPLGVVAMMRVPDVGPKTAKRMWEELGVTSVAELAEAAQAQRIRELKGFSAKSEEKILKNIQQLALRKDDRTPIGDARPVALDMMAALHAAVAPGVIQQMDVAGSLRRWKETIGDMDLLAASDETEAVMDAFGSLPQVAEVLARGSTKSRVALHNGLQMDLRVVAPKHWGAALQYFTGSKEHNVQLREIAQKQGWSLNEYGLTATDRHPDVVEGQQLFFQTEESLYNYLGLDWVAPELREATGEVDLARKHLLPDLITLSDIQGEVHGHTTWSDGQASVKEMAEAARLRGYAYWTVSDHSIGLGVVQGVDAAQLRQQAEEIAAVNADYAAQGIDFRLLQGIEVEILADGSLGLADEVLATLDVVVASIHSAQRQDRETITARCLQAVRNPHVDILGHPTSRLLGRRPPTELDVDAVLQVCAETGTVVEINANPARLDLKDAHARRAVELGCKIAISSDAHETTGMEIMEYGMATARRGWIEANDVINTRSASEMLSFLKK